MRIIYHIDRNPDIVLGTIGVLSGVIAGYSYSRVDFQKAEDTKNLVGKIRGLDTIIGDEVLLDKTPAQVDGRLEQAKGYLQENKIYFSQTTFADDASLIKQKIPMAQFELESGKVELYRDSFGTITNTLNEAVVYNQRELESINTKNSIAPVSFLATVVSLACIGTAMYLAFKKRRISLI